MNPRDRLRHHVTGAIERGEAEPIVEQPTAKSIIERSRDGAGSIDPQVRTQARVRGQADGAAYLAGGKNTVDGQALMRRMKNGPYKNGFHAAMRAAGGGY